MQWYKILEEWEQKKNIRNKTIIDVSNFIYYLKRIIMKYYWVSTQMSSIYCTQWNITSPSTHQTNWHHQSEPRNYEVPSTYLRGHHRIDYYFCTQYISLFIGKSGITSFNEITTSDNRGIFLNIRRWDFLKTHILPSLTLPPARFNQLILKA